MSKGKVLIIRDGGMPPTQGAFRDRTSDYGEVSTFKRETVSMETQERKEVNRRGASFSRHEIRLAVDALRAAPPAENKELRDEQYKLLLKFRRMQDSFND